jgi:hypothetical protein
MNFQKNLGIAVVVLGAVCTLAIMVYATSWENGFDFTLPVFYLWVLLPYVVLLVSIVRIHQKDTSTASRAAILITSISVVTFSQLIYYDSMFVSLTSTSALIFVFLPIYALAAIAIIYLVSRILVGFLVRQK